MDLNRLDRMKQRLLASNDFDQVVLDFLASAIVDDAFLDMGSFIESTLITDMIKAAGRKTVGSDTRLENLTLKHIEDARFVHGSCILGGRMASVIYFEDVGVGVVGVASSNPDPTTEFIRFQLCPAQPCRN